MPNSGSEWAISECHIFVTDEASHNVFFFNRVEKHIQILIVNYVKILVSKVNLSLKYFLFFTFNWLWQKTACTESDDGIKVLLLISCVNPSEFHRLICETGIIRPTMLGCYGKKKRIISDLGNIKCCLWQHNGSCELLLCKRKDFQNW